MKRIVFIGTVFFLSLQSLKAQPYFTLQSAIDTALAKNIPVKQSGLLADQAEINLKQARANLLPDLAGNFNHGLNQGRSIDPFTNTYVDQGVNYANYGLSSGIVV